MYRHQGNASVSLMNGAGMADPSGAYGGTTDVMFAQLQHETQSLQT